MPASAAVVARTEPLTDVDERAAHSGLPTLYRWNVAARCFLAFAGGFIWISTFGALLATLFARADWMPVAQGVHIMTLFGFVGWCGVAMWVFHQKQLSVVTAGLIGSSLLFYLLFLLAK